MVKFIDVLNKKNEVCDKQCDTCVLNHLAQSYDTTCNAVIMTHREEAAALLGVEESQ